MPRAKAKSRHTTGWWGERLMLSQTTRDELIDILDLESPADKAKADAVLQQVEKILGQAKGMKTALDEELRAENVLVEMAPIQDLADQLIDRIDNLSSTSHRLLQNGVRGVPLSQLRQQLDRLTIRIERDMRRLGKMTGRHAPVKHSIRELVYQLGRIFYYCCPTTMEEEKDAKGRPIEVRQKLHSFLQEALGAIDLPLPSPAILLKQCQAAHKAHQNKQPLPPIFITSSPKN